MNKSVVRSLIAVASGWAVAFAGGFATMLVIAICNPEGFRTREAASSTGSLLVTLLVSIPWSVIAGFVTARIARRDEIKHGIGLILLTVAVYACNCFLAWHKSGVIQTPVWYHVAGQVLLVPSVLFGAWLQMRRRILPQKAPAGVAEAANDLWLSIMILVDQFRLPIAVVLSVITALAGTFVGIWLMGIGILGVRKLMGLDGFFLGASPLCLMVSFFLSCMLARRVFKRIMTVDDSRMKDVE